MTEDLEFGKWVIPGSELEERFTTSGGPGGQHANRSETAVRLRFDITTSSLPRSVRDRLTARLGATVEVGSADQRSQHQNREMARRRLVEKLEGALAEKKKRRATKPTRASKQRRLERKRARSEIKRKRRRPSFDD